MKAAKPSNILQVFYDLPSTVYRPLKMPRMLHNFKNIYSALIK